MTLHFIGVAMMSLLSLLDHLRWQQSIPVICILLYIRTVSLHIYLLGMFVLPWCHFIVLLRVYRGRWFAMRPMRLTGWLSYYF